MKNVKHGLMICLFTFGFLSQALSSHANTEEVTLQQSKLNAHQFSFISIDGKDFSLRDYHGQVLLIVNTASQCGFTKQYKDLQSLYETYKKQGFTVIGIPCNDFGSQEPGDLKTIKEFTQEEYGVTFPLTQKYTTRGGDAHPFFTWASGQKKGAFLQSSPKWNFHKFLVDKDGDLFKSYGSHINPLSKAMRSDIDLLLARSSTQ